MRRRLLDLVTSTTFRDSCWQNAAFHLPSASPDFEVPLDLEAFSSALFSGRLDHLLLQAGFADDAGLHQQFMIRGEQARPLLRAGCTIQINKLELADPRVKEIIAQTQAALRINGRGDMGLFMSEPGSGYGIHFDHTEMWILQLGGRKTWRYSPRPAMAFPDRNVAWENSRQTARGLEGLQSPDELGLIERTLEPGDLLYLPGGCWHGASATEFSVHAALNYRYSSFWQILVDGLLRPLFSSEVAWRAMPKAVAEQDYVRARLEDLRALLASPTAETRVLEYLRKGATRRS